MGSFTNINWANGPWFLKTETDPNGGSNYTVVSVQQLLSVPYALYAKEAGNGFSGNIMDYLTPNTIPYVVTALNQAGVATQSDIPSVPTNVSAFNNDAGYITISAVPTVPTHLSAYVNDMGYISGYTETDPQFNAWDKNYNDLTNKPTIPTVPTNVSAFTNDAGYVTEAEVHEAANIPTNVSAFVNDAGYLTSYTEQQVLSISNDTLFLTGGSFVKLPAGFDGNYNSLTNKPEIPTVPANVSAFTNDAGYITSAALPTVPTNVGAFSNDAHYVSNTGCDSIQFCDILARLNAMQAEIDALKAMMPADTTQPGSDTTVIPDPVDPSDTTVVPDAIDPMDTLSSLACPDMPKVTDFDGNEYNTVKIGNQCWLRENIRSTHYSNGVAIPLLESLEGLTALPEGRLYPDLSQDKVSKYGYLYTYTTSSFNHNLTTVGPITGVCPAGWRMPTSSDWDSLFNYLSQWDTLRCNNEASQVVKAIFSRVDWAPSTTECAIGWNAANNNATGFSIKPAGYVENGPYGVYGQNVGLASGTAAYFYTSSATVATSGGGQQIVRPWLCKINTQTAANGANFIMGQQSPTPAQLHIGASIRCVKDEE